MCVSICVCVYYNIYVCVCAGVITSIIHTLTFCKRNLYSVVVRLWMVLFANFNAQKTLSYYYYYSIHPCLQPDSPGGARGGAPPPAGQVPSAGDLHRSHRPHDRLRRRRHAGHWGRLGRQHAGDDEGRHLHRRRRSCASRRLPAAAHRAPEAQETTEAQAQ